MDNSKKLNSLEQEETEGRNNEDSFSTPPGRTRFPAED